MTREEAKQLLQEGEILFLDSWSFSRYGMSCDYPGCCDDSFDTVEEALDHIESLSNSNWDEVWSY